MNNYNGALSHVTRLPLPEVQKIHFQFMFREQLIAYMFVDVSDPDVWKVIEEIYIDPEYRHAQLELYRYFSRYIRHLLQHHKLLQIEFTVGSTDVEKAFNREDDFHFRGYWYRNDNRNDYRGAWVCQTKNLPTMLRAARVKSE